MPLGVRDNANLLTSPFAQSLPSTLDAEKLLIMFDNGLKHDIADLVVADSGIQPNPTTQDPTRPMTNLVSAHPQEVAAFGGGFVLNNNVDRGFISSDGTFGSNRLKIDGVEITLSGPIPDYIGSGEELAALAQAKIRGSALGNAAGFSVVFGVGADGSHPTESGVKLAKFKIFHSTDTFALASHGGGDNFSALPMMGFTDIAYAALISHTSENQAWHEFDQVIMKVTPNIYGPNRHLLTDAYRFAWLVNCNAGPNATIDLMFASTAAALFEAPDSDFTLGEKRFRISGTATPPLETFFGESKHDAVTGRFQEDASFLRVYDIGGERFAATADELSDTFVKLRISDPQRQNHADVLSMGYMGLSAGFWAYHNPLPYQWTPRDSARLLGTADGSLRSQERLPGFDGRFAFGQQNPLYDEDAVLLRSWMQASNLSQGGIQYDWLRGNNHPVLVMPRFRADLKHSTFEPGEGETTSPAVFAESAAFGFLELSGLARLQAGQWSASMTFRGI